MCVCLSDKGLPGTAFGQFWLVLPDWKRFFPKGSPLVTIAASQGSTANWEDTLYGQAVLCPFQAYCAREFRPGASGRRGTDGALVTMRTLSTQLDVCPSAGRKSGNRERQEHRIRRTMESSPDAKSLCLCPGLQLLPEKALVCA